MVRSSSPFGERFRLVCAVTIGLGLSSATSVGITGTLMMPAVVLRQPSRRSCYQTAAAFYAAALSPLIPGARNFFGPNVSAFVAIGLWIVASALLAFPWACAWSADIRQAAWRVPLAIALAVIPPLGIIGWASPLTAAGVLFPGLRLLGLVFCALLTGALARWPRYALAIGSIITLSQNLIYRPPRPLSGWEGVNTHFGAISHGQASPLREYRTARWIQEHALSSPASVIVFPETVVPVWTAAADAYWQTTFDKLNREGKTILVGTRVPIRNRSAMPIQFEDFSQTLTVLTSTQHTGRLPGPSQQAAGMLRVDYDNAVMIRGATTGEFRQRIPVPIAMWNPTHVAGASMHLFGPSVVQIANERAAFLICYEQLLTWPIIRTLGSHPTILVAVANDYWATSTGIPRFQDAAIRSWARLFGIPYVAATNT